MSDLATAPPPVDSASPPAAPEYDFATALSETLDQFGGDAARALKGESSPAPAPPVPAAPPPAPAPAAKPAAAPVPDAAAPESGVSDDDPEAAGMLENLLSGGDLKAPLPIAKPGDAPTDPNSREFQTWKELRGAYDVTAKELADFKKRLAETESKIPKDYDQLKAQLIEKDSHIAKIDLFQNPTYQREVAMPISSIEKEFDKLAGDFGVSKALLREAVAITDDREREDAINRVLTGSEKTVPVTTLTLAVIGARNLQELLGLQQQYMDNAPKVVEMLREQEDTQKAQMTEREKEEYGRAANVAVQIIERTLPFLKDKDGRVDPEIIKQIRADADKDFTSLKPGQRAFALMSPAIITQANKTFKEFAAEKKSLNDEIAKLKLQLSKYVSASPSTTSDTSSGSPPAGGHAPGADPFEGYSGVQLSQLPI